MKNETKRIVTLASEAAGPDDPRGLALIALCLGVLMVVLDATAVNVALPSIRAELDINETSLVWVVNAYLLTFGGFLLVGGRLGDIYGRRQMFLIGMITFTVASLACGMASTMRFLVGARAVQGVGGAMVVAVSLSLIGSMFARPIEQAKALGVYGFITAGGGTLGLLLGGVLTSGANWHWIFLANLPVGVAVCILSYLFIPRSCSRGGDGRVDVWGSITVVGSLTLTIYAIGDGNSGQWMSYRSIGMVAVGVLLFILFLAIETRVPVPLVPLRVLKLRNLAVANIVRVLWAAGISGWLFISALYMQLVLGYGPMRVALAYLPMNLIVSAFALGLSARLVTRFSVRVLLGGGMLLGSIGVWLFRRVGVEAGGVANTLPGMVFLGLGVGITFIPLLLAAMNDVGPGEAGLASGIVNTAARMGSAMGLATVAWLAGARAHDLLAAGATGRTALIGGYRAAFLLSAIWTMAAAAIGSVFLRTRTEVHRREGVATAAVPGKSNDRTGIPRRI